MNTVVALLVLAWLCAGALAYSAPVVVNYGAQTDPIRASGDTSDETSWMITINHNGQVSTTLADGLLATAYRRWLAAHSDCGMTATFTSRRVRVAYFCESDTHIIEHVVADLRAGFGSRATIALVANTPTTRGNTLTQLDAPWALDRIDVRARAYDGKYIYDDAGAGTDIWIVDTGVRTTHHEFAGGRAQWVVNTIGGPNEDCDGHGTHVAAIAAGATYGVAKQAQIRAVKVLNCQGGGTLASVLSGLDVVADLRDPTRATVINLSLVAGRSTDLDDAVAELVKFHGIAVVVAAGNDNQNACNFSPSGAPDALTVAATTSTDALASYSNFGQCVDLAAPGSSVLSAWASSDSAVQTLSGTSMASPHVAGAVALAWSQLANKQDAVGAMAAVKARATAGVVNGVGNPALLYTRLVADPQPVPVPAPPSGKPGKGPGNGNGGGKKNLDMLLGVPSSGATAYALRKDSATALIFMLAYIVILL